MIEKIIEVSLRQRAVVLIVSFVLIILGVWSAQKLSIDAVPDLTSNQVQINTPVPALAPLEVEKLITSPIELAMSGLPDVEEVRSISLFGLSQVTVVFKDSVDIYFARQLVAERLQQAKKDIPDGLGTPMMGPVATGLGEIYFYTVDSEKYNPIELRTIHDWIIKPQLRTVPGVAEVNAIGGFEKEYQVLPDPNKLLAFDVTLQDLFEALAHNNANAGGSYIEKREERYLVRAVGLIQNLDDIRNIVITVKEGMPVYVRDVADVQVGSQLRNGSAAHNGKETIIGTVLMLKGENSRIVSIRVKEKLQEIQKIVPEGVKITTVYDRSNLVNKTIATVRNNLFEGGLFVIAVLFILLGNFRASLIVAAAIPLSMLFTLIGMVASKTSGNLMSLGAIDFGLIVDGAVIMVENIIRRLSHRKKSGEVPITSKVYLEEVTDAATEVARPVVFAVAIITIVYLPILTLEGIEGKMFRPMALTVVMALIGSLLFTLTLIPVLCSFFLGRHVEEKESKLLIWIRQRYHSTLHWAIQHPKKLIISALIFVVLSFGIFPFLGSEFIPRLDEESLAIESRKSPAISLAESTRLETIQEEILLKFPEVSTVFSRIGTAEIATDPMGPNATDIYIMFKRKVKDKEALVEKMSEALSVIPGVANAFSQPIELRVNELVAGVRSDIAIKLFGEDLDILKQKADQIVKVVSSIRGAQDVRPEQVTGLPVLQVEVDRQKIARYGINVSDVLNAIEIGIAGKSAGEVFEGVKRFDLILRNPDKYRNSPEVIGNMMISTPNGEKIPLAQLVQQIEVKEGPAQISHEQAQRRIVIELNIRGRDMGSFVDEAKVAIEKNVKLPAGYSIEWGGQFKNLESARGRLMIVIPLALFLIFFLLFLTFNSFKHSILVFLSIPLAITGGILALLLRGLHFNISAGVGFIALFGVAMLNGIVMISFINQLLRQGMILKEAVIKGAEIMLRPVLMTSLVASLGFVPMALSHGTGAEVQRPLATVVIGGVISSTILTLILLPVFYILFEKIGSKKTKKIDS